MDQPPSLGWHYLAFVQVISARVLSRHRINQNHQPQTLADAKQRLTACVFGHPHALGLGRLACQLGYHVFRMVPVLLHDQPRLTVDPL